MEFKDFEVVKLSQIGTLGRGKSKHRPRYDPILYGGCYPFIQTGDVKKAGKILKEFEQTDSEAGLTQSKLWKKNTLCITIAANIAETTILGIDACFPDSIVGFNPNENKCSVEYIYYYFQFFKKNIQSRAYGSVQENINLKVLNDIDVILPPLNVQKYITSILSPIDQKIEVNNQIILKLEELSQTLFKQWFKEFEFPNVNGEPYKSSGGSFKETEVGLIPKTWEVEDLSNISEITYGKSFKSKYFNSNSEGIPLVRIRNISNDFSDLYTTEDYAEKYLIKEKEILIGMDGEFCLNFWKGSPSVQNQRVLKINSKSVPQYYLYMALKRPIEEIEHGKVGTTVIHLAKKDIDAIKIIIPDQRVINLISKSYEEIMALVISRKKENVRLEGIRDTLLPKLFSGEIDLSSEIEVNALVSIP